jgi:cyclopropane fatty-acyl-phospholipid synthase-like methyltransferase
VAKSKGFTNLTVITGDVVDYEFEAESFDRVVSIELFEHMKNYQLLLEKVSRALKPGGKLFLHIFCHKDTPYDFDGGWMSEFFFTGGMYKATLSNVGTNLLQEQCHQLTFCCTSSPVSQYNSSGG